MSATALVTFVCPSCGRVEIHVPDSGLPRDLNAPGASLDAVTAFAHNAHDVAAHLDDLDGAA